jgi:hypothetical protein
MDALVETGSYEILTVDRIVDIMDLAERIFRVWPNMGCIG